MNDLANVQLSGPAGAPLGRAMTPSSDVEADQRVLLAGDRRVARRPSVRSMRCRPAAGIAGWISPVSIALLLLCALAPAAFGDCGNAIPEGDEECDDGGVCVGGTDEGTYCSGPEQCTSGECRPAGGDGCAANCTEESTYSLVLDPEASEIVAQASLFRVPVPVSGSIALRVGGSRESAGSDEIPVAVRAADLSFEPISAPGVPGPFCLCIRGADAGHLPAGVSGTGSISCAGPVPDVDILSSVDHNTNDVDPGCGDGFLDDGSDQHPHVGVCNGPEEVSFSGTGPVGSVRLDLRLRSWTLENLGPCAEDCGIPENGPDCRPCTEDDLGALTVETGPTQQGGGGEYRGPPLPLLTLPPAFDLRLTTGRAAAEIRDANNEPGRLIGAGAPCGGEHCVTAVSGTPLDCAGLETGPLDLTLTGALPLLDAPILGDFVATFSFGSVLAVLCTGDCDGTGTVEVHELITLVNVALDTAQVSECGVGDSNGNGQITVDELVAAVGSALEGCGEGDSPPPARGLFSPGGDAS